MESDLGIIGVDYPEFDKDGKYRCFRAVWGAENTEEEFATGNVEMDYVNAFNHLVEMGCSSIIHSSSIDNFLSDNHEFYEWLDEDEGEGGRIVKRESSKRESSKRESPKANSLDSE